VRIVAATNRSLEQAVVDGQFREDLFFRLNVVSINVPPLRERREEIPLLSEHFVRKYSVQYNKPCTGLSEETQQLFADYDWPGNVRELENVIKRAIVLGDEAFVRRDLKHNIAIAAQRLAGRPAFASPGHTFAAPASTAPAVSMPDPGSTTPGSARRSLKDISRSAAREAERELILKTLEQTRWNRKETAGLLGISYKALLYKIKDNGLARAS
jgi:two-component system response regulator AtoC